MSVFAIESKHIRKKNLLQLKVMMCVRPNQTDIQTQSYSSCATQILLVPSLSISLGVQIIQGS